MTFELFKGDSVSEMKKIPDKSVDLILTDPPYNLAEFMKGRQTNLGAMRDNFFGDKGWDDLPYHEWISHMAEFLYESKRVLKPKGALIIFMAAIKVESIVRLANEIGLYYKTTGIWHKRNPMPRNMNLHFVNSNESWIYFINEGKTGTFNNNDKLILDYIETSVTPRSEKMFGKHPTQKPVELMKYFVRLLSNEDDMVLDPLGSGSSGVAAVELNRKFIGIELSDEYFNLAQSRIQKSDANRGLFNDEGY